MTLRAEFKELKEAVATLQAEVRLLRRGAGRADTEGVEALFEYLHGCFGEAPWQSFRVFEQTDENPALYAALVRCLGETPTIQAFSKLLMRNLGDRGGYTLRCLRRSNGGKRFVVLQCSTAALKKRSTVKGRHRRSKR